MKKSLLLLLSLCLLLASCKQQADEFTDYHLQGVWTLLQMELPTGLTRSYSPNDNGTYCIVFDGDSLLYESWLTTTPSGLVVLPTGIIDITLVDKGGGELLYLENGDPHPLHINGDSLTIQRNGIRLLWLRADDLYQEWGAEIRDIVRQELQGDTTADTKRYFLSIRERQQELTIWWLGCVIAVIVLATMVAAHYNRKVKRQLQLQLQQIQEVQANWPPSVRQAVASVESSFFGSDDYAALQRRIASGQRLKDEEWATVEERLKTVYPGFATQLRGLHQMSELEYRVCLLIKLRIAPKDIATVLARDVSTISTTRSRLYKKVFGQKGGAKEWDDFILSMGT